MPDQTSEERGREALRNIARTWLLAAGASARDHLPAGAEVGEAGDAVEHAVNGLLGPLKALCAADDEAAEALGVLLYKAATSPPEA